MFNYQYQMEYVCSFMITLHTPPQTIGVVAGELRVNLYASGGEVSGPKIRGRVLPGGVDFFKVRADGIAVLDVHLQIETHDKAIIDLSYSGVGDLGPDGLQQFIAGTSPKVVAARAVPRMSTAHPDYQWLNRLQFVSIGAGDFGKMEVSYDVYALR